MAMARKKTATKTVAKKAAGATDKVAMYDRLIATRPEMERKGDANPYTAVNGNMFTVLMGRSGWGFGCRRRSGRSF